MGALFSKEVPSTEDNIEDVPDKELFSFDTPRAAVSEYNINVLYRRLI